MKAKFWSSNVLRSKLKRSMFYEKLKNNKPFWLHFWPLVCYCSRELILTSAVFISHVGGLCKRKEREKYKTFFSRLQFLAAWKEGDWVTCLNTTEHFKRRTSYTLYLTFSRGACKMREKRIDRIRRDQVEMN